MNLQIKVNSLEQTQLIELVYNYISWLWRRQIRIFLPLSLYPAILVLWEVELARYLDQGYRGQNPLPVSIRGRGENKLNTLKQYSE